MLAALADNRTPPAPANPFGTSDGADRWEAGNMAKALLGRSDYTDAIKHFQSEVAKDRTGAMPYLAAVHEEMAGKNPELAGKFATQMREAGLSNDLPDGPQPDGTVRITIRPRPEPEPGPEIETTSGSGSTPPKFDPRYGDSKTPPVWKADTINKDPGSWERFNKELDNLPGMTAAEKFSLAQLFAAEGGTGKDPTSSASGGILQQTLNEAKQSGKIPGLDKVTSPKDLDMSQRAQIMRWYFDSRLRTVGGSKALDWVGNDHAAAALADTMFRHGTGKGAELIQRAINKIDGDSLGEPDGKMGPATFNAYQRLASDPNTREKLLNTLADARDRQLNSQEKDRTDHYRFKP